MFIQKHELFKINTICLQGLIQTNKIMDKWMHDVNLYACFKNKEVKNNGFQINKRSNNE
jgi:hypothetical protein